MQIFGTVYQGLQYADAIIMPHINMWSLIAMHTWWTLILYTQTRQVEMSASELGMSCTNIWTLQECCLGYVPSMSQGV